MMVHSAREMERNRDGGGRECGESIEKMRRMQEYMESL